MNKSESIKELATALAKAQGEITNAAKNAKNPHFRNDYADLGAILDTVRPVFSKHGLSIMQMPSFTGGILSVETLVMHTSGEWISSTISAPVGKQDAQGIGSATTYCRRYSLAAVAGIAQTDDDAESAIGRNSTTRPPAAHSPAPKAQEQPKYYPDTEFTKNFPEWQGRIQTGKARADDVINQLNTAGFWLTDEQLKKLGTIQRQEAAA